MGEVASETKVATQMGNQGTANDGLRHGGRGDPGRRDWATSKEVHVWTNRPIWPQGMDRPAETDPVPCPTFTGRSGSGPAKFRAPLRARRLPPVRLARLVGLRHRGLG